MKKTLVLTLAALSILFFAGMAQAQTAAPSVAPTTSTAAAKPPSAQQTKMKACAAQYHQQNIPKSQYHTFMGTCLKKSPAPTPAAMTSTTAPATPTTGVKK